MLERLLWEEEGQTIAEYGPIMFFIALLCIVILTLLGTKIRDWYAHSTSEIGSATNTTE